MLLPLLQIGELHSKYLQVGWMSKYYQWYKAALTASGVEPTDPSILSGFQRIDAYTTSIAAYAYSWFNTSNDCVFLRLLDIAKGKIFIKI